MPHDGRRRRTTSVSRRLSRRRMLQSTSVIGALGIAGCLGDDPASDGEGNGAGSNGGLDTNGTSNGSDNESTGNGNPSDNENVFSLVSWLGTADPTQLQFNPYNTENSYGTGIFEGFAQFNLQTFLDEGNREWLYRGVNSWNIEDPTEGGTVILQPPEERSWHDGDEVNAEDLYTKLTIENAFGGVISNYIDSLQVGDGALEITLSQNVNGQVFEHILSNLSLDTKRDLYSDYVEQINDSSTDDEINSIMGELTSWNLDEPVGTAPYKLVEQNEQFFRFDIHDGHPLSDEIGIDGLQALAHTTNESKWQYAIGEECDMMESGTPSETIDQILSTDTFDFMLRFHWLDAIALTFNHEHDIYGQREVRQALAYLLNRDSITQAGGYEEGDWGQVRFPQEHIHGINVGGDVWLDDEFLDSLNTYGPMESRPDEATELLQTAGYERNGNDTWVDGNGDTLTMELRVVSDFGEFVRATQSIEQQISDFGIEMEVLNEDSTSFFNRMYDGDFGMCTGLWGEGTHPYYMFQNPFYNAPRNDITTNHPGEVEIPMPVGDTEGSLETVNVHDRMNELGSVSEEERIQELVQELAWAYNQSLPQLPIWHRYGQMFLNTSDWEWPDLEALDTKIAWAQEELFLRGWPRGTE